MRRSVFLDHSNATKNTDNSYSYDFKRYHDRNFNAWEIKTATALYAPTTTSSLTSADIEALTPWVFLDFTDKVKMSPANIAVGDGLTSITSKGSASIVCYSSATGLEYSTLTGSTAPCIDYTVNWHYIADTSQPQGGSQGNEATFTFVFETSDSTTDRWLFKNRIFRIKGGSVLKLIEDTEEHSTTCTLQTETPFLCQMIWDGPTETMSVELINLTDMTSQTDSVVMDNQISLTPDYNFYMSNAQSGALNWKIGSCIELKTKSPTAAATCISYFKQQYTGEGEEVTGAMPHSLKIHSDFFNDCRIGKSIQKTDGGSNAIDTMLFKQTLESKGLFSSLDGTKYTTDGFTQLDKVDLEFRKPDGTVADVSDFCVTLDLFNNVSQL